MQEKYWIGLSYLSLISYNSVKILLDCFKTPKNIWEAKEKDIKKVLSSNQRSAENIIVQREKIEIDKEIEKIKKLNIDIISINDYEYPILLKQIHSPPFVLYIKGKYNERDNLALAVVGTRSYTNYGKVTAEKLTEELLLYGFTIVSGLAYGIDTFAHRCAVGNEGRTIAVLGTGLDYIYPRENKGLAEKIIENGALISEFPLGIGPLKYNFPQRNRIISGLSMGVLIIEGKIKSGAMITASCALEQGREVFCVPGQINNTRSEAPNSLIKDGAKLVQNVEDIVNELSINVKVKKEKKIVLKLSEVEKKVIGYINQNPKTIDQISEKLSIGLPELSLLLVELESKKIIESIGGGKYTCQLDLCI